MLLCGMDFIIATLIPTLSKGKKGDYVMLSIRSFIRSFMRPSGKSTVLLED